MEAVLDALWRYIQARTWLEAAAVTLFFVLYSTFFVWLAALTLARTPWPVKDDAELKVHLGALIALSLYVLVVQFFVVMLAFYKGISVFSLDYFLVFLALVITIVSLVMVLGLCKQIQAKLDRINKKRKATL
ncbi:MAG: hypothetical protein D4R73_03645 [Deltaproteobacteria bacterium]|nr:MAG: hypothetical protein D4R73_03645 [Deltaproteobacteria bacterium]